MASSETMKIGNIEISTLNTAFIIAGILAIISAFLSYVDASAAMWGWETHGTTVFNLYHHYVGGELLNVSWIRAAAVAVPVCGLLAVIFGLVPSFTENKWVYILDVMVGTVAVVACLLFMKMGANVDVFGGIDAVIYGQMLYDGLYKLSLAIGFYIGLISSIALLVISLINAKKLV